MKRPLLLFFRIVKFCGLGFLLTSLVVLIYLRQEDNWAADIRSGKLGFTAKAGWVNWGHARPERVEQFLKALAAARVQAKGAPFSVQYSQKMSEKLPLIEVESTLSRRYQIVGSLTQSQEELVALSIFRDVSEAFEAMQGRFPNSIDARSVASSFREGDLAGNQIAFYRAIRGYSEAEVRSRLEATPEATALQKLQQAPPGRQHSWNSPPVDFLNEILLDPAWLAEHVTLLSEQITWFGFSPSGRPKDLRGDRPPSIRIGINHPHSH